MLDENVTIGKHFHYGKTKKSEKSDSRLITDDCIGVELELERAGGMFVKHPGWAVHADHSLRNGGAEFVFNGPASGADAVERLSSLTASIAEARKAGAPPIISARTSTHVHVDVTDLTKKQLMRMIVLYAVFENVMFNSFAEDRVGNHFCLPISDCIELVNVVQWLNSSYDTFASEMNHPNIGRYSAFNLKSIFKHGTVEFRHAQAMVELDQLLLWINACLAIKRGALSMVDFEAQFFTASAHGFDNTIRLFFPRDVAEYILNYYSKKKDGMEWLHRDMVQGIRFAQHLCSPKFRYNS